MIEVYLDESGSHENSPVSAVSAVWATKEIWNNWTVAWLMAKAPIRIHHSTDCHNRVGEYRGWTRQQRDAYVLRILPTICDHFIEGHFATIDSGEVVKSLRIRELAIPPALVAEGHYLICLNWAMRSAWDILTSRGIEHVAFVHEQNDFSAIALKTFGWLSAKHPERSATFAFGLKTAHPPLQCADVLAFEGNRQMRGGFQHPRRKPLQAIDPVGNRFGYHKLDRSEVGPMVDLTADFLRRQAQE